MRNIIRFLMTLSSRKYVNSVTINIDDETVDASKNKVTSVTEILAAPAVVHLTGYCKTIFLNTVLKNEILYDIVNKTCATTEFENHQVIMNSEKTMILINDDNNESAEYGNDMLKLIQSFNIRGVNFNTMNWDFCKVLNINDINDAIKYYFDKELTSDEAFDTWYTEVFNQAIKRYAENYFDTMCTKFNDFNKNIHAENIKKIQDRINELNDQLDELNSNLQEAYLRNQISMQIGDNNLKQLFQLFKRNKAAKIIGIKSNSNQVTVHIITDILELLYVTAEDRVQQYVTNFLSSCGLAEDDYKMLTDMYIDALLNRNKWVIKLAPLDIGLTLYKGIGTTMEYSINDFNNVEAYVDGISRAAVSTHWDRYRCLGEFTASIAKAKRENNMRSMYQQILQYMQTINLGDTAGVQFLKVPHVFYNKSTNEYWYSDPYNQILSKITSNKNGINVKRIVDDRLRCYHDIRSEYIFVKE